MANRQCTHCGSGDHKTYLEPNIDRNMQRVKALIDFGTMSIFYRRAYLGNSSYHTNRHSPSPWPGDDVCKGELKGKSCGSVFWITSTGWRIGGFSSPNDGIQPSLGLAMARNPEMDCCNGRLPALWTPNGLQRAKIPEADRTSPLTERGEGHKIISPATAFDHLWGSEEVVEAFALWLGECQGLLGAALEGITIGQRNHRMLNARAGAEAVVASEEWQSDGAWRTATGSPRHDGRNWTTGVVYCDELSDPANLGPLPISTLPKHATMQTRLTRIGTDIVNVEMVTDDGGRIPAQYQDFTISRFVVCSWDRRTMWTNAAKTWQTPAPRLSRHPNGIQQEELFWLEEGRKTDRGNDRVTRIWGTTQIAWIYEISERASETKSWER